MANANETVANFVFTGYANRINAAHNREVVAKDAEIAELRECLKEAVELITLGKPTIEGVARWRKALEGEE